MFSYLEGKENTERHRSDCDYFDFDHEDFMVNPFLIIVRNKNVALYNKNTGIKCPGTYCGFLQHYDDSWNHIAIYCRKDDKFIGEKIIGGCLFDNLLNKMNKKYLQVIFDPKHSELEISKIDENTTMGNSNMELCDFKFRIKQKFDKFLVIT